MKKKSIRKTPFGAIVVKPNQETYDAWGGQPIGQFCITAESAALLKTQMLPTPCPLCDGQLVVLLNAIPGEYGRVIFADGDRVMVDPLPEHMEPIGCLNCRVVLYRWRE